MKVVIGGNRLGAGKKMHTSIDNYGRSTHNLSDKFQSSMTCGVLYPYFKRLVTRGDSFKFNIGADCRTIPTVGPLFGKFKMQIDFFECPIRLYQGILHNNPVEMGLNINKVMLPKVQIAKVVDTRGASFENIEFSKSSLMKYLGVSGLGHASISQQGKTVERDFNALPALSYYDIFKNYYANKQEDNAYVITSGQGTERELYVDNATSVYLNDDAYESQLSLVLTDNEAFKNFWNTHSEVNPATPYVYLNWFKYGTSEHGIMKIQNFSFQLYNQDDTPASLTDINKYPIILVDEQNRYINTNIEEFIDKTINLTTSNLTGGYLFSKKDDDQDLNWYYGTNVIPLAGIIIPETYTIGNNERLKLQSFPLKNIDKMRYRLLTANQLGTTFKITSSENDLPYKTLVSSETGETAQLYPMSGLVVKTYQNDIFNNWLNTELIDGENGINELTKVTVDENGQFSMNVLAFKKKLYRLLNRVMMGSDGTYEGWLDVTYEETYKRHIETPIWLGGMSKIVEFDEIVQNSPTNIDGDLAPLGTLGGRGRAQLKQKGGHFNVKVYEPGYIIGIVSLTPLITYTQGNDWDMTELDSIDDLHKPEFDGIGFQDLLGERLAYFDTELTKTDDVTILSRNVIGKLPSWIEYMTAYDRAYGDFAKPGDFGGFMVLNRNYEQDSSTGVIKDATTYIDPKKFNYAFADIELDSQNFWVEIHTECIARRLMSAKIIPNV